MNFISSKEKWQRILSGPPHELGNPSWNSAWSSIILNWWCRSKCFIQGTEEAWKMSFSVCFNHDSYIISAKHLNISHASYIRLITASQKHWKTKHLLCSKGNIFCEIWNLGTMFFKQLKEGNGLLSEKIFPVSTPQEVRQQSIYVIYRCIDIYKHSFPLFLGKWSFSVVVKWVIGSW